MLHVLHHVLQDSVSHITDEQIMLRMTIRQERGESIRVISYHESTFVVLVTAVKIRVISYRKQDFSYQDSCYQLPDCREFSYFSNIYADFVDA